MPYVPQRNDGTIELKKSSPFTPVMQSVGKWLTYIMMVSICNLRIEYGNCTAQQMYKNVQNNAVKITDGL